MPGGVWPQNSTWRADEGTASAHTSCHEGTAVHASTPPAPPRPPPPPPSPRFELRPSCGASRIVRASGPRAPFRRRRAALRASWRRGRHSLRRPRVVGACSTEGGRRSCRPRHGPRRRASSSTGGAMRASLEATARVLPLRLQVLDGGQQLLCGSRCPANLHGSRALAQTPKDRLNDRFVLHEGLRACALPGLPYLFAQVIQIHERIEVRLQERGDASEVSLGQGLDAVDELASGHGGRPRAGTGSWDRRLDRGRAQHEDGAPHRQMASSSRRPPPAPTMFLGNMKVGSHGGTRSNAVERGATRLVRGAPPSTGVVARDSPSTAVAGVRGRRQRRARDPRSARTRRRRGSARAEAADRLPSHDPDLRPGLWLLTDRPDGAVELCQEVVSEARYLRLVLRRSLGGLVECGVEELDSHGSTLPDPGQDACSRLGPWDRPGAPGVEVRQSVLNLHEPCRRDISFGLEGLLQARDDVAGERSAVGSREFERLFEEILRRRHA